MSETKDNTLKKTPFNRFHHELGGKMVDFFGWEMPVQFKGIMAEHKAVREDVGMFDVSHMGEIIVKGAGAHDFVPRLVTRKIGKMKPGKISYSPMCYHDGGVVDDLLIYMLKEDELMLVVNASNIRKDYEWILKIKEELQAEVEIENVSDNTAQLALQGPRAAAIVSTRLGLTISELKYYRFMNVKIAGVDVLFSRTGYTGEDGFEMYFDPKHAEPVWSAFMSEGDIQPIGLGARDSLRLEAGMMLYGNDITKDTSALTGLSWTVALSKEDFIGRAALAEQREHPPAEWFLGIAVEDRAIPRHHTPVQRGGVSVGMLTSGGFSPYLGKGIGMGYFTEELEAGTMVDVIIKDKPHPAKVVALPFYKREK